MIDKNEKQSTMPLVMMAGHGEKLVRGVAALDTQSQLLRLQRLFKIGFYSCTENTRYEGNVCIFVRKSRI